MSKAFKILSVVAVILILAGVAVFLFALNEADFDFTKLATQKLVTNTYEITDSFENIKIDVNTTDVTLVLSDDGKCRVEFLEEENVKHIAKALDNTLIIGVNDMRKWYEHIGIFFESTKMTLYLPLEKYSSLVIYNDTGDIELPYGIAFDEIKIDADTSDINCFSSGTKKVGITTATGEVIVNGGYSDVKVLTDTGDIKFNVKCMTLNAESDTGDISFDSTMAITSIDVESDTGDVFFKDSDAGEIKVNTSTGDVRGTLLTDKIFFTETSTGDIRVPKTSVGGICDIKTSTGDIRIEID